MVDLAGSADGSYVGFTPPYTLTDDYGDVGILFNTTGDYAHVPLGDFPDLDVAGNFSYELVIERENTLDGSFWTSYKGDSSKGIQFGMSSGGAVQVTNVATAATLSTATTPITGSTTTYQVGFSKTGSNVIVYVNGTAVQTLNVGTVVNPGAGLGRLSHFVFTGSDGAPNPAAVSKVKIFKSVWYDYPLDAAQFDANWDAIQGSAFVGCVNAGGC